MWNRWERNSATTTTKKQNLKPWALEVTVQDGRFAKVTGIAGYSSVETRMAGRGFTAGTWKAVFGSLSRADSHPSKHNLFLIQVEGTSNTSPCTFLSMSRDVPSITLVYIHKEIGYTVSHSSKGRWMSHYYHNLSLTSLLIRYVVHKHLK